MTAEGMDAEECIEPSFLIHLPLSLSFSLLFCRYPVTMFYGNIWLFHFILVATRWFTVLKATASPNPWSILLDSGSGHVCWPGTAGAARLAVELTERSVFLLSHSDTHQTPRRSVWAAFMCVWMQMPIVSVWMYVYMLHVGVVCVCVWPHSELDPVVNLCPFSFREHHRQPFSGIS